MKKYFFRFVLALSFLSRLAPGCAAESKEISASLDYYPLAGAVLGAVLILPFALGIGAALPWVQSFLYVLLSVFLTRALHWDGWADLFDALGSGKNGEAFVAILKDSRVGSFGVLAIALGVLGQIIFLAMLFSQNFLAAILWSVIWGRCCVAPLAFFTSPADYSQLGVLMCENMQPRTVLLAIIFGLLIGIVCTGLYTTLLAFSFSAIGIYFLRHVSQRQGGVNGDFFGCAIIWGEFSALLACLLQ